MLALLGLLAILVALALHSPRFQGSKEAEVPYVERSYNPDGSLVTIATFTDDGTLTVTDPTGKVLLSRPQSDDEKQAVAAYNADVLASTAEAKLAALRAAVALDRAGQTGGLNLGLSLGSIQLLGNQMAHVQDLLIALVDSEAGEDR